jgi:hypothetical protein
MAIGGMMNQLETSQNIALLDTIAVVMIFDSRPFHRNFKLVFAAAISQTTKEVNESEINDNNDKNNSSLS